MITVIIVKIKISAGLRPAAAARLRMSATIGAITCVEGPLMNTHSAWVAANWRPRVTPHGKAVRLFASLCSHYHSARRRKALPIWSVRCTSRALGKGDG